MQVKTKRNIIVKILKILLIILSYIYIVYKIKKDVDISEIKLIFSDITFIGLMVILLVSFLMFFNWTIEAIKWKKIIKKIQIIKLFTAIKAVFMGITLGIYTPNRIGELGGRVLVLQKKNRIKGVLATSLGSFSQFLVTVFVGLIGISLFFLFFNEKINILHEKLSLVAGILIFIFAILFFIFYFKIDKLPKYLLKIKFLQKFKDKILFFAEYKTKELFEIFLYSLLRYFIFITQFYLLLQFFSVDISIFQAFISISATYLLTTLIPAIVILDLGIRGSVSVFFIGIFSCNISGILLAAISIWFINLVIPAIIGSWLMVIGNRE